MAITLWTELTLAREAVGEEIVTFEVIVVEIVADLFDEFVVREDPTGWIGKPGERDYLVSERIDLVGPFRGPGDRVAKRAICNARRFFAGKGKGCTGCRDTGWMQQDFLYYPAWIGTRDEEVRIQW